MAGLAPLSREARPSGRARERRIALWLAHAARQAFVWSGFDCATGLACGWIARERGVDPSAAWRGRYRTALGAARLARRHGGLIGLARRVAREAGLSETVSPGPGDVALILAVGAGNRPIEAFALRTARRWALLSPTGLTLLSGSPPVLAAWAV